MTVAAIKKRRRLKRWLIIVLVILLLFLIFLEIRVRPTVSAIAIVQGKRLCTEVINEAVSEVMDELELSYEKLAETTRAENGSVLEIATNMANVNKLKTEVSLRVGEKLEDIKSRRIDVPMGTLMGLNLLYMRGPDIPLHISMSGSTETDFVSEFESGGINQTVHKLSLTITTDMTVLVPPVSENKSVTTTVVIAETIIVGEVPNYALYGGAKNIA